MPKVAGRLSRLTRRLQAVDAERNGWTFSFGFEVNLQGSIVGSRTAEGIQEIY